MFDYFNTRDLFTSDERQIQSTVRQFLNDEASPFITECWETGSFPVQLIKKFGNLGLLGANLPIEKGGVGLSNIAYGIICYELERIDSALRSFVSVQSSLVMYPIYKYGSQEQQAEYLSGLAKGEILGCFALTEGQGGSDPDSMHSSVRKEGDTFVLNGSKMWITNGTIADIAIVWAKDKETSEVMGFIVPTDTPGFTANPILRKMSLRISDTAEISMNNVRIPTGLALPKVVGLRSALSCLTQARYGISWGAMVALESVYQEALDFSLGRATFNKPIAGRQLIQDKLVRMVVDHTKGLLMAWRLGKLKDDSNMTFKHASLAKRENVRSALNAARIAREILGASGITLDHASIRHMLNLETVDTYEGTHDIHTLILGKDITGQGAFS